MTRIADPTDVAVNTLTVHPDIQPPEPEPASYPELEPLQVAKHK